MANRARRPLLAALCAAALAPAPAMGGGLGGTYRHEDGGVTLTLSVEQPVPRVVRGTLTGSDGTSLALEGELEDGVASGTCSGAGAASLFEAELEGDILVLTLVEVGAAGVQGARSLEFTRASNAVPGAAARRDRPPAAIAPERNRSPDPAGAPANAAERDLLRYFAGEYYSFTSGSTLSGGSGTERTVKLCPDGTYRDSYESSASGTGWGEATARGGGGRWRMEGDRERGVLVITGADGRMQRVPYQVLDRREQTIRLGAATFAFAGAARCP